MALKSFIFTILFLSIAFYFTPIENLEHKKIKEEIPQVIFENSTMYTINDIGVSRVVNSSNVLRYKTRDEMYLADITIKNQDKTKDYLFEKIKADKIEKRSNLFDFIENVEYLRDDFVKVNTDYLKYDEIKKLATNSHPFKAIYKTHNYDGTNLYLDGVNNFIKSKNTHFKIDLKDTKENK
ncbi:LPS export ABC transporter periplasmic protein LptC [Arcobacter vandammei]|uniref:LPS export ABC transporter periplasmic protein LptC n=1 Tax=Arcobacter vandammei TaxID=2782243 RepID=UPI0018E033F4|nr:LPS export ABC transporter periplasmic protein LptC [Arcobacter vandammei]